VRPGIRRKF